MKNAGILATATPLFVAFVYLAFDAFNHPRLTLSGYALSYVPFFILILAYRTRPICDLNIVSHVVAVGLAQVALLGCEPTLSEDIWRYVWDGFQLATGHNPYCSAPSEAHLDDFSIIHRLDEIRGLIGHPQYPTIYPPMAQFIFSISGLFPPSDLPIRILGIGASLGSIYLLYLILVAQRIPGYYVLLMSTNPLFMVETAVSGHVDTFGVFFMLLGFYCVVKSSPTRAMFSVAFAILTKLIPILIAPYLFKSRIRAVLVIGLVTATVYLPFWLNACSPLGSLPTFAGKWQHNAGLFVCLQTILGWAFESMHIAISVPPTLSQWLVGEPRVIGSTHLAILSAKVFASIIFLGLATFIWRLKANPIERAILVLAGLLLCIPVVHPWYLLWVLPGLPFLWHRGGFRYALPLLWWSWSILAAYVARVELLISGIWSSSPIFTAIEYLGLLLCLVWTFRGVRAPIPRH